MTQQERSIKLCVYLCSKPVTAESGCCLVGRTVSSGQAPAQDVWLQAPSTFHVYQILVCLQSRQSE